MKLLMEFTQPKHMDTIYFFKEDFDVWRGNLTINSALYCRGVTDPSQILNIQLVKERYGFLGLKSKLVFYVVYTDNKKEETNG